MTEVAHPWSVALWWEKAKIDLDVWWLKGVFVPFIIQGYRYPEELPAATGGSNDGVGCCQIKSTDLLHSPPVSALLNSTPSPK